MFSRAPRNERHEKTSGISMPSVPLTLLRKEAARFSADRTGNVAVLFGIACVPLITFIGVAVDYSRAAAARTAMQSAVDSAALMASKDYASGVIKEADIPTKVDSYMRALYTPTGINDISVSATFTKKSSDGTSTVSVIASGKLPTSFMKLANVTDIPFRTTSTSTWGATRLRVAMALDVTGSMNSDGKLPAMKTAAIKLINTLKASATSTADVYIAIIPFNQMVNVGTSNKSANWLDWSTDYGSCSKSKYITKATCEDAGKTWSSSGTSGWDGCVTDRDLKQVNDNDTTKVTPTTSDPTTLYVAKDYSDCNASLLPMKSAYDSNESDTSTDATTLKGRINSLWAQGATNQAIGMHWAWMALQLQSAPFFSLAKDTDYKYSDVIILLSDGVNTKDYWYGNGSSYSSQVDDRQRMLCDNIKNPANGIVSVYTIQVNTDGDPESAVLKYCANDGQFFQSTTSDQIDIAFQAIGSSLTKLRLQQ
jgi:Flp pilus assembly protein TadG